MTARAYPSPSADAIAVVLDTIAEGGKRGMKVATVVPRLILDAARLGELVEYDAVAGGVLIDDCGHRAGAWSEPVVGRGLRADWIERLATSITTEAIDRFTAKDVVEILLRPK